MILSTLLRSARCGRSVFKGSHTLSFRCARGVSTLPENPHIYVFKHPLDPNKSLLSLLPTEPPTPSLAIGTTTSIPPTPDSFAENREFSGILQSVLYTYASQDPDVKRQAAVFASPGDFNLGNTGGGARTSKKQGGGMGNTGGWIHVSDSRNPPDWGRIAWPEDIFGSLEVDGHGRLVDDGGNYQPSGTYRMITREGILGLPPFIREKLVERLRELEQQKSRA